MNVSIEFKKQTIGLLTRRLIPFLMLLYLIAYIDRSNISVAALQMNADLGLSQRMYGIGVSLFYIPYILFELPSNLVLSRVGARRWIARIMVTWGLVACGMAFIQSAGHLYTMRILLGMAEAGFTPGIIYYLSRWFPSNSRAGALSLFYISAALASVVGLPLSGALLNLDGIFGLAGWRWIYFVEGLPAIICGIIVIKYLPDRPADARWLSSQQAEWLEKAIAAESTSAPQKHSKEWTHALSDPKVWLLALFWLLQAFGTTGITIFLPQVLKAISGGTNTVVSLLAALPFVMACILMLVNGRHSDASGERRLHLGLPLLFSGILLIAAIYTGNLILAYAMLVVSVGLNWAVTPVFWAVTTEYFAGGAVAACAIALINAVGNFSGVGLPPVIGWLSDRTGSYDTGLILVGGALILGGWLGLVLAKSIKSQAVFGKKS